VNDLILAESEDAASFLRAFPADIRKQGEEKFSQSLTLDDLLDRALQRA